MTENKDKHSDKDKDQHQSTGSESAVDKEHNKDKEHHDRSKRLTQFMDLLTVPGSSKFLSSKRHSAGGSSGMTTPTPQKGGMSATSSTHSISGERSPVYSSARGSFQSEVFLLDMDSGELTELILERYCNSKDEFGTQRVYKKTSPNCVLTLYLPTREITLSGNTSSVLRGIVFVDPKAIQGYRVYAQLTLTFRYGREDEEVMGLRFCNEAIMSLHQVWPRNEEPPRESLSPLQEALVKRLGDGAHPFTLTLSSQAPPSVQLVPAKRYYGAPIGTSYDVRCFIADKTDEKFHRRASVKMGVRVIYRTDVFHHNINGPENFAALINNQTASPPATATTPPVAISAGEPTAAAAAAATTSPIVSGASSESPAVQEVSNPATATTTNATPAAGPCAKARKSERGDSFPKLRLSPKSFRFSGRFGRSKSEIEKCPNDAFYNYSKSFQEYDSSCGGPQGAVDKPFLLQDGRVGLRASLDKAWYTHGEDVCVTVNIKNDSRKTVRKIRVCAIQHVDVCMFNNGKFKNVVADSDSLSPVERTVPPGGTLNSTIVLKPQRGPTKNWIALEDTLQRSTEPDEITGAIAASAIRSPNFVMPSLGQVASSSNTSPAVGIPHPPIYYPTAATGPSAGGSGEDRNVFAIYVSYYVKVKLTLSGMGGELSLKLPFVLVHIDEDLRQQHLQPLQQHPHPHPHQQMGASISDLKIEKLALDDVPTNRKNGNKAKPATAACKATDIDGDNTKTILDRIESMDDELHIRVPSQRRGSIKPRLVRSETLAKDLDEEIQVERLLDDKEQSSGGVVGRGGGGGSTESKQDATLSSSIELEQVHVVQVHNMPAAEAEAAAAATTKATDCHEGNGAASVSVAVVEVPTERNDGENKRLDIGGEIAQEETEPQPQPEAEAEAEMHGANKAVTPLHTRTA